MPNRSDAHPPLDLEAAHYFKLNPNQMSQLSGILPSGPSGTKSCSIMSPSRKVHQSPPTQIIRGPNLVKKSETQASCSDQKCLREMASSKLTTDYKSRSNQDRIADWQRKYMETIDSDNQLYYTSASSNSLPSVSSSPSVSPSLLCPHLSLDDLLGQQFQSDSPHTIGLCASCRLNPPPNFHSPLSPMFQVSFSGESQLCAQSKTESKLNIGPAIRRGYSDHQKGAKSTVNLSLSSQRPTCRSKIRDDSLDYYLEPKELARLQMSPTLRNSVEFIRNNTLEAGRVIKLYKNGEPFDRPLRICIKRGEFSSLIHLLDHINGRQLIPSGARYLFHLDGQLVYSEHELKHGSAYIVSGSRNFDYKANAVLKDKLQSIGHQRSDKVFRPVDKAMFISEMKNEPKQNCVSHRSNSSLCNAVPRDDKLSNKSLYQEPEQVDLNKIFIDQSKSLETKASSSRSNFKKLPNCHTSNRVVVEPEKLNHNVGKKQEHSIGKKPAQIVRAKSELSSKSSKPKRCVTFMDTGMGSSLTREDFKMVSSQTNASNASQPKEFSSQPELNGLRQELDTNEVGIQVSESLEGFLIDLPIPTPGAELNGKRRSPKESKVQNAQISTRVDRKMKSTTRNQLTSKARQSKVGIVLIKEKQLSKEEMKTMKKLANGEPSESGQAKLHLNKQVSITVNTVDVGSHHSLDDTEVSQTVPKVGTKGTTNLDESQTNEALINTRMVASELEQPDTNHWQYPGGREASATPIERPVSQSEASEAVHARVVTPSPSLSTMGESNSITMSIEVSSEEPTRKQVTGVLHAGFEQPDRNFKLAWVNGFSMNDQYTSGSFPGSASKSVSSNQVGPNTEEPFLSPTIAQTFTSHNLFNPNQRFHNWLCYSRLHDELIYPAGCLIVLWTRLSCEQRYYAAHTSNISALTLASLDQDLAASAQIAEPSDKSPATVHLWSISSLDTMRIIVSDQLSKDLFIFSLKLRNTKQDGCLLSFGAKEGKKLWLYCLMLDLTNKQQDASDSIKMMRKISDESILKASKPLSGRQAPIQVIQMYKARDNEPVSESQNGDLIISFGQSHFQTWLIDRKRRQLVAMELSRRSPEFAETIDKASCIERLSTNELLLGDCSGNISLIKIERLRVDLQKGPTGRKTSLSPKCKLDQFCLVNSNAEKVPSSGAITCLARISERLFVSGHSSCHLHVWKMDRGNLGTIESCLKLTTIAFPQDIGFVVSVIPSKFSRKFQAFEFFAAFTSNSIFHGALELVEYDNQSARLSLIQDGHESSVMNLVADTRPQVTKQQQQSSQKSIPDDYYYFTCSLDCKIIRWNGKSLVWKSILPSPCASMAVHPIGFVLAVGSTDGTIYILDKFSGLLISYFPLTPVCINCLAYSRDGSFLAAGCANGSIFILPVYDRGLKYKKVSIFQSPYSVVSIQFSLDNKYILTSVTHSSYQELILWDLSNFRYMRDNVTSAADKIEWFDSICSGSEDVRAIWENTNMVSRVRSAPELSPKSSQRLSQRKTRLIVSSGHETSMELPNTKVINLSCHRLIIDKSKVNQPKELQSLTLASDTRGYLRLFRYPCRDIRQGFYEIRTSSSPVSCCRFLALKEQQSEVMFVSSSIDGCVFIWTLV